MFGNSWHKKEKPLLGLTGMGGGVGSNLVSALPPAPISATGGSKSTSGLYTIHSFTSPGAATFVVSEGNDNIQYLVVGGGGGGSQGGGGGGGMRTNVPGENPGGPVDLLRQLIV